MHEVAYNMPQTSRSSLESNTADRLEIRLGARNIEETSTPSVNARLEEKGPTLNDKENVPKLDDKKKEPKLDDKENEHKLEGKENEPNLEDKEK